VYCSVAFANVIDPHFGYDEINLNIGFPSDRVKDGRLWLSPCCSPNCVAAMKGAVTIPVTVKCQIGIDDQDPELALDVARWKGCLTRHQ